MAGMEENNEITKCGICTNYLTIPKSLSCLHMFCCQCLYTYFSSEKATATVVVCPVCETEIQGVNRDNVSSFIEGLPTNDFIETYVNRLRLTEDNVYCGPCLSEEKNENAEKWCEICNECLCLECYKVHKKLKNTRAHKVISIHDIAKDKPIKIEVNCRLHKDKLLDSYCKQHKLPSCRSCEISRHRKCKLIPLDDAVKDAETGNAISSLLRKITECSRSIESNIIEHERLLKKLEDEKSDAELKIQRMRSRINEHLERLELSFNNRFQTLHTETTTVIKKRKNDLEKSRTIITNCEKLLRLLVEPHTNTCAFVTYHDVTLKIEEEEARIKAIMSKFDSRNTYNLTWIPELFNWRPSENTLGNVEYQDFNIKIIPQRQRSPVKTAGYCVPERSSLEHLAKSIEPALRKKIQAEQPEDCFSFLYGSKKHLRYN